MENLKVWQGLFDLFLWGVIVLILSPALKYPYKLIKSRRVFGILLILLFCIFPFWGGDYFHYKDSFDIIKMGGYTHLEAMYSWLILNVVDDYSIFRLIIWGFALTLLFLAYKRVGQNFDQALYYFAALYLPWFSYARASLAMACILLGITFLVKPIRRFKIMSMIMGVTMVGGAIFFHKSAIVGMVAVLATFFVSDTKRNKIILTILLYPIAVYFIAKAMDYYMMMDFSFDEETNIFVSERKRDRFLSGSGGFRFRGLGATIGDILNRGSMLLMPICFVYFAVKGYYQKLTKIEKYFGAYVLCIVLLAVGFILTTGYSTQILFYRTLFYAYPANAVFLSAIKSRNEIKGLPNVIYWMGFAGSAYVLLYATYCAIV